VSVSELLFCPSSKRWLLRLDDDYWKITSRGDALVLASVLTLQIMGSQEVSKTNFPRGTATVASETSAGCILDFFDLSGRPDRPQLQLAPLAVVRASVEWLEGYHQDRWLSCEAAISVEGARRIGIRTYLPPTVGQTEKSVRVLVDGNTLDQFEAVRSRVTEFWLDLGEVARSPHRLDLISAYPEVSAPGGDGRSLGFLVVSLNVDDKSWVPPETFA
jgi:hypothetical protein